MVDYAYPKLWVEPFRREVWITQIRQTLHAYKSPYWNLIRHSPSACLFIIYFYSFATIVSLFVHTNTQLGTFGNTCTVVLIINLCLFLVDISEYFNRSSLKKWLKDRGEELKESGQNLTREHLENVLNLTVSHITCSAWDKSIPRQKQNPPKQTIKKKSDLQNFVFTAFK